MSDPGGSSLLLIEAGLTLLVLLLAFGWPRSAKRRPLRSGFVARIERGFGMLARRQTLAVFTVGAAACVLRLAILPFSPLPHPFIYDDFSYLLAGDTFASGRLTNLTHPMWIHFESFHITFVPSYQSMYFPAQGMVLAAGKLLFGNPWFGVVLSVGLMCAAFCWMLQGWLPPGWALLGGFIAMIRIALFSYWMDQFWGGAISALGGALLLGAVPRIRRWFRARDFLWMALGMAILANSRPYEGLLVSIPSVAALCWWIAKRPHPSMGVLARRFAPAALVLALTLGFIGYYDFRVFGNPFTPAYVANRAEYAPAPHFLFQSARPEPVYRHKVMREFYIEAELRWFQQEQTPMGLLGKTIRKAGIALQFYFGFVLLVPLAMLPWAIRDRRLRFLYLTGGFVVAGLLIETWLIPHYLAPFAPGIYAILLQCMRHMRAANRGRSAGFFLVRAIPAICLVMALVRLAAPPLKLELPSFQAATAFGNPPLGLPRARVLTDLEKRTGGQLAIVRYSPKHLVYDEWVYNAADIDGSKVVWAREMDPSENSELLHYYKDRTAWLVEPDYDPPRVTPYPIMNALAVNSPQPH